MCLQPTSEGAECLWRSDAGWQAVPDARSSDEEHPVTNRRTTFCDICVAFLHLKRFQVILCITQFVCSSRASYCLKQKFGCCRLALNFSSFYAQWLPTVFVLNLHIHGVIVCNMCFTPVSRSMVNKPKEFAHLLRDKFGSADQINMLGSGMYFSASVHVAFYCWALRHICS